MKRFAYATLKNFAAFGVSGVLQLIGTFLVVSSFGLAGQGVLSLFRLGLPGAFPSIFDAGAAETSALAVARGRANKDWETANHTFHALFLLAILGGLIAAGALCVVAVLGSLYFQIESRHVILLLAVAGSFPFFFVALVGEGVLRGFERYGTLRLGEVVVSGIVALAPLLPVVTDVLVLVWLQLALSGARALLMCGFAYFELRDRYHFTWRLSASGVRTVWPEVRNRALNGLGSKTLAFIDMRAQPLLIAPIWGVAAAGLFDLLSRVPLLLKTVVGILNQAVMPIAVRADTQGDGIKFKQILVMGITLGACIVWPAMTIFAVASKEFLRLWVGAEVAQSATYMAAMLLVPAATVLVGFVGQALFGRFDLSRLYLGVHFKQVLLNYLASMLLSVWLGANAFLLCTGLGWLIALPFYLKHAAKVSGASLGELTLPLVKLGALCSTVYLLSQWLGFMQEPSSWVELSGLCALLLCVVCIIVWFGLPPSIRNQLRSSLFGRR